MNIILSSLAQGLLWSILAIGVYLTFRILDLADLSVEGTLPLGAAVGTILIVSGMNPFLATFLAFLAGCVAGVVTGLLHTKLKIPALLAGIITMTGLYSINLRIMGQANLSLLSEATVFDPVSNLGVSRQNAVIIISFLAVFLVILLLAWFFKTELGLAIISTGDNIPMSEANGINVHTTKIIGYMISNGLIALSGALLAQNNGYADVNMGIGAIVIGLASIIIGEAFFGSLSFAKRLIAVVVGSILYQLILVLVLELRVNPQDLKLFSAIILAIALGLPVIREKLNLNRNKGAR